MLKVFGALLGPFLFLVSCQDKTGPSKAEPAPTEQAKPAPAPTEAFVPDLDKGRRLYMSNCLRCHNADPNRKGSIGPEMVDAPLEVMVSKVMTGKYPDPLPQGFVPKRKTRAMQKIPKLEKDIPHIHAWVQSMKKKK